MSVQGRTVHAEERSSAIDPKMDEHWRVGEATRTLERNLVVVAYIKNFF